MTADSADAGIASLVSSLVRAPGPFAIDRDANGVPTGFQSGPHSFAQVLARAAALPDRAFSSYRGVELSVHEVLKHARALAQSLLKENNVVPGDRIALFLPNGHEWIVGFIATFLLDGVAVALPWPATDSQLNELIELVSPKLVLCNDSISGVPMQRVVQLRDLLATEDAAPPTASPKPDADALIVFTSGSTGRPKAVVHSQKAWITSLRNMVLGAAIAAARRRASGVGPTRPLGSTPTAPKTLVASHLSHVSGYAQLGLTLMTGGRLVIADVDDPDLALLVRKEQVNAITGIGPRSINSLAREALRESLPFVRAVGLHGFALDDRLREEIRRAMPDAQIATGYGQTEAGGGIAMAIEADAARGPHCVGYLSPMIEVEARGSQGAALPAGEIGRLWIRGSSLMTGYIGHAPLSSSAGWHDTGDLGFVDKQHFLHICGRARAGVSDEISIAAQNLTRAIRAYAPVEEIFVIPTAEHAANSFKVFATLQPGYDAASALRSMEQILFEANAVVIVVDEMPRTRSGKIDETKLRA